MYDKLYVTCPPIPVISIHNIPVLFSVIIHMWGPGDGRAAAPQAQWVLRLRLWLAFLTQN